jgi:hypothetical protein
VASVVSSSDSLYGDDTCWGAATPPAGNLVGVDPLVGPLADNGGPTLTRMPQPGSPAIDALSPPAACDGPDQRGALRPQGVSCDIGAVEVGVLFPGETADSYEPADGGLSLRERIAAADASPGPDTIELLAGATYVLDRCGPEDGGEGELDNTQGDLDVADAAALTIDGNGATIVQTCAESFGVDRGIISFGTGTDGRLQELTLDGADWGVASLRDLDIVDTTVTSSERAAVRLVDADLSLIASTVSDNGAGVVSLSPGSPAPEVRLERSTVSGNGGDDALAGGLLVEGAVTLLHSTVAGNTGAVGGIDAEYLNIDRSTLAGNTGGDVDELSVDELVAVGAIVGEGVGESPDCAIGHLIFSSFVLYGDADCQLGATPPDIPPTDDQVGVDPRLGPLADNGGPTLTRRPGFTSPVVDAVLPTLTCVGEDQRGVARPQGASCDLGAVELDAPGAPHFTDVPVAHQFFWEVECLAALEVTEGFEGGTFRPTLPISRQGVVAWLYRLAGEPEVTGVAPFSDVPASHPFHDAILWASQEGIADGYSDGTFRPGQPVARQGVAAWLWRLDGEPTPGDDPPVFSDVPAGSLFEDPIAWLASSGVTEGFEDGTFRPTLSISRQGLAAWICRYDEQVT